jgi:GT2 family glycosyltransferase
MLKQPLVYIIILNYNGWENTLECIESIKNIDYVSYKIIIVDNCSTDNSMEELNKKLDSNIALLGLNENLGFAAGNNRGIKVAIENNADYVLILNNDVIVDKMFLGNMIDAFQVDEKIGMIGPKIYYYDKHTTINSAGAYKTIYGTIKNRGQNSKDDSSYSKDITTNFIMGCCMLIKCKVIKEIGYLDEE